MFYSFTLFGKEIPMYAVCMYLGMAVAVAVACLLAKKRDDIDSFDIVTSAVYTMVGAMIGAKVLFIAISWRDIIDVIHQMNYGVLDSVMFVLKGGFVFYGGFIGGFIGLLIYMRQFKCKMLDYMTIYATVLPLGHAFGRVGCFCGGCCYGMKYDGVFAVDFPIYPTLEASPTVSRLPIQLFEAAGLLLIFALLMFLYYRVPKKPSLPLWSYLVAYPILRFVLEFWRGDKERGGFLFFSTSQWISLGILAVASVAFYLTQVRKNPKDNENDRLENE